MSLLLLKAADFSARKHRDQRRKDGSASPYINHPIAVARVLAEIGAVTDEEVLAAALLHDTLEDTETTPEELTAAFGERVCSLVREVTDDKSLAQEDRKRAQIEHARSLSPGAALIKLGDKICNVQDVIHAHPTDWSLNRRRVYLDWAEAVITAAPKVNKSLEDRFREVLAEGRGVLCNE